MTTALSLRWIRMKGRGDRLRPRSGHADAAPPAPGPFAAEPAKGTGGTGALVTALLVLYPAFATVAVVLAVILFTGSAGSA